MWIVYIIQCADGSFYTGITTDMERRLAMHGKGTGAKYTRGRGPFAVVHTEILASRSLATKREAVIKRMSREMKRLLVKN